MKETTTKWKPFGASAINGLGQYCYDCGCIANTSWRHREEEWVKQCAAHKPSDEMIDHEADVNDYKPIRQYATGATRDTSEGKHDIAKFISPLVTEEYCRYMHGKRVQPDGKLRDGDNWQRGIPKDDYMQSLRRHVHDVELHHNGFSDVAREDIKTALCATIFNASGMLFEILKEERKERC